MDVYIKKIRAIAPLQNLDTTVNILIRNGIIEHFSESEPEITPSIKQIDGQGLVCSPGFFDMHVHLREPGAEDKETIASGCSSAANGGFTAVCCMPNTTPAIDNPQVVEYIKNRAQNFAVDVFPSAAITQNREGKQLAPMFELADFGVVMFTDDGSCVTNSDVIRRAFDYSSTRDLLISQHCEDTDMTKGFAMNEGKMSFKLGMKGYPNVAEESIIARDIMLAEYCNNARYHVSHISTRGGVDLVRKAKQKGLRVTCEATPHHFALNDEKLESYNTNMKMNPPLRSKEDVEAIIEGLLDGTIDCIASDHAPHTLREKEVEFEHAPCGILGLETSVGLALTILHHQRGMSLIKVIEKMAVNPRKVLQIPQILLKIGEKANLTLFAPDEEWVFNSRLIKSKSRNTPFDGYKMKGKPKFVINNDILIESEL